MFRKLFKCGIEILNCRELKGEKDLERKRLFKVFPVMFLLFFLLLSSSFLAVAYAQINIDQFPRIDEIYFTIAYPEATAMSYARSGYLDTVIGMINPDNVEELEAGAEGIVLKPDGAGTYTEWTASEGANWECVDDGTVPDGDTTYVYSTTDGAMDSYSIEDPGVSGDIASVTIYAYARYENLSAPDSYDEADGIQFVLVQGTTINYSSTIVLSLSYPSIGSPDSATFTTNPATGEAWTWDEITALEVGYVHVARGNYTDKVVVTSIFIEVAYVPPGVYPWSISMNPGFHMCYLGINCRDYPPEPPPGKDYYPGAPYGYRGPDFELWPLNESDFRLALHYLIGCRKDEWISTLYRFINVRLDTTIPPANLFYYNRDIPPMPYDPEEAMNLLTALGWSNETGKWIHQPSGRELRPIYVLSPVEAPPSVALTDYCVASWNEFFGTTDSPGYHEGTSDEGKYFHNYPITFYDIIDYAWCNRDFDIYFLCWGLGRDPDYLYYFFHPDLDYWDGYNSPGLRTPNNELEDMLYAIEYWQFPEGTQAEVATNPEHPSYVGMTIDSVDEMKMLVDEVQWWLYYLVPYIPLYSRNYINAYRYGLTSWIESRGYGSHNSWTYGFMHWKDLSKTSFNMHVSGPINNLHPGWAESSYEWQVLDRIFDGFLAVDPFTHKDVNWAITGYEYELFNGTTPGGKYCDGSRAVFHIRPGIRWHDGENYTAEDAKFSWECIANYKTRTGSLVWLTFVEANVIDDYTIEVYYNGTGIWILYEYAGTAMIFAPQIWGPYGPADADNNGTVTLSEFKDFKPWETPHPNPPADKPWLTCLIGTGPFIFKEWDVVAGKVHEVANRDYFAKNFVREDINIDGIVDIFDAVLLAGAAGATPEHPRWEYGRADINADGIVDIFDAVRLAGKAGRVTLPIP